ncbi:IS630 family transposase [Paenibacillus puerhi]|uniref:IS630 family transposase n=1 Tax=Paenibacillus puerhi TaxID=2692622 RepID=UPI0013597D1A|nr:IS630 family transposase [Paenibacillus puerhi]
MSMQEEWNTITAAMKETNSTRFYERCLAIRLHLEGRTFTEIASILGRTYQTISTYWKAYQEDGLAGLELDHAPGGPKKLTDEQERKLADTIKNKRPADVGFEARFTWTLKTIAMWIKREFGETFTERGVSKMLERLGFSYTKATYTLTRASAEEQEHFREETLPELKEQLKSGEIQHLLFEDESMIRAYLALQYNWFLKGQQRKIPTYGRHEGAKLFAAIHYETGYVTHREEEQQDAAAFQRFLVDILTKYPEGKIVVVLDNSRVFFASEKCLNLLPKMPRPLAR